MKRSRRSARTPLDLWADGTATVMATATTLAIRVPQLLAGTMTASESRRMIAEKGAAARDGAIGATLMAARTILQNPRRRTMADFAADAFAIADAAVAPAQRTVKANAKRLSVPRSRKAT